MKNYLCEKNSLKEVAVIGVFSLVSLILLSAMILATPVGPSTLTSTLNSTKPASPSMVFNSSGGYISTFNLTINVQDPKWKAFVGNASSTFTLDDASGSTIYNWASISNTGRIYASRNSTITNWGAINCSNATTLGNESLAMNLTNSTAPSDNIPMTFNMTPGNSPFYVGAVFIGANTCPTLLPYVNNVSQTSSTNFQEVPLFTPPGNLIYETPIQSPSVVGYNGQHYNFQMLVPENGTSGFNSATAYYLYVELGT